MKTPSQTVVKSETKILASILTSERYTCQGEQMGHFWAIMLQTNMNRVCFVEENLKPVLSLHLINEFKATCSLRWRAFSFEPET